MQADDAGEVVASIFGRATPVQQHLMVVLLLMLWVVAPLLCRCCYCYCCSFAWQWASWLSCVCSELAALDAAC